MTRIFWIAVLVTVSLGGSSCAHRGAVGKDIVYSERKPFLALISPHLWTEQTLYVQGKKFDRVKGRPPFFLSVTNSDRIFFVTEDKTHNEITYHLYSLRDRFDIAVDGRFTSFGYEIGNNDPYDSERIDWIEWDKMAVSKGTKDRRTIYILDLGKRIAVSARYVDYDGFGNIVKDSGLKPMPLGPR
jgi:hypothetical protein